MPRINLPITRQRRRFFIALMLGLTGGAALAVGISDAVVRRTAQGRCFDAVTQTPTNEVGLVLGTNPRVRGGFANPYYENRLNAAAELFRSGKVQYLLVSGDNGTREYDEPTAMRRDLIRRGVPDTCIVCDYAGFRTLDSVIRAQKVFGQSRFTVISQRYHNERALYIARCAGLDAVAFDAADPSAPRSVQAKIWMRERLSRVAAVLDMQVTGRQPKFLGAPVRIGTPGKETRL